VPEIAARIRKNFGGTIPDNAGAGTAPYAAGAAGGGGPTGAGGGSSFLQEQRARFAEELKQSPQLRKQLAALTTLEGNPANVAEALANRAAYTGKSLHDQIWDRDRRGRTFYGPINKGQLPGAMAGLERNPKRAASVNAAIDAVLAGRNVLRGATDQGMVSDPNGRWRGGRVYGLDQVYNDWGGGPGGHEGARRFREEQQRQVLAAAAHHGAHLRDFVSRGRKPQTDGELLRRGMKAVDAGDGRGTNHNLTVDFQNMPRGVRTAYKGDAGLFKQVALNRGRPMNTASEAG
jgi:hypothetical protein